MVSYKSTELRISYYLPPPPIFVHLTLCYLVAAHSQMSPGPAVIKLFESENELKCKNRLHDFKETLYLFSNFGQHSLRHFTVIMYRYNYLVKLLLF